jgi:hypothetical protein
LKPRLKDAKLDKRLIKEILVRLIYVEMLGHDASWGHVKALQACSETSLLTKKVSLPLYSQVSCPGTSCVFQSWGCVNSVEMRGHDASWGHVKALQACSETSLLTKKVSLPMFPWGWVKGMHSFPC